MTIHKKLLIVCSIVAMTGVLVGGVWYLTSQRMMETYLKDISKSSMRDASNAFDYILTDTDYLAALISLNQSSIVEPLSRIYRNEVENNGNLNMIYLENQRIIKEFIYYMNNYKYYIVGIDILSAKAYRFSAGHIVQNYDSIYGMIHQVEEKILTRSMVMLSPIRVDGTWLKLSSDYVVPSVRGIFDQEHQLIGYTILYFDYSVIENMFSDHLPRGSLFQVQNSKGELVFSNCGENLLQTEPTTGYVYETYEVPKTDWMLHMMIPNTVYLVEMQKGVLYSGLWVLVIFCGGLLVATMISRQISRDILRFKNVMEQVAAGDLMVRYEGKTSGELRSMAVSFNHMVEKLQELVGEISRREKQKQEMEMQLLQAQINPHFVSNTLNVVAWMAKMQHADNIVPLTTALSRLLRNVMRQKESFVPLSDELEYARSYLEIMECSGNYCFEVVYDIGEDEERLYVPRFILQPIIENAILHGMSKKLSVINVLQISAKREGDTLTITVEDNGEGMTAAQIALLYRRHAKTDFSVSNIGIPNVIERIHLYCGEEYGLWYESEVGSYTRAIFKLPCMETVPESETGEEMRKIEQDTDYHH